MHLKNSKIIVIKVGPSLAQKSFKQFRKLQKDLLPLLEEWGYNLNQQIDYL